MDEQQKRLAEELLFSSDKKLSFVKKIYFGHFDSNNVFPHPIVTKEERAQVHLLAEAVNTFAAQNIDGAAIDRNAEIPAHVIQGLGKMGVFGITVPKNYGGLGMTQYAYCRVLETIARYCGSTALLVNAHQSIGLRALLLFGTEKQRERWLPPLAKGEYLAAFSLTEANAGSDASNVETTAVFDPQKNVYILNGRKQWTTNGSVAQVLTVMAKTEVDTVRGKEQKITAFLVTPDMPGFHVLAAGLEKVGMRGTKTSNLEFKNMEVPAENILGPKGAGLRVCLTCLDFGRTAFGATCTGSAKVLLEKAIHHARTRHQFNKPLASFSLVKRKITMMSALTYAMDAATYLTAGLIDSGEEDFMLEAAILKVFVSDSLWSIIYDTMQILGGRSFFTDEPYERMMRDARLNMIGEGSNEVMRAFIGLVGMREVGMQLKGVKDSLQNPFANLNVLTGFAKKLTRQIQAPVIPVASKELKISAEQVGSRIRSFNFSIMRLLAYYREDIIEKQLELDRIATSAIAIYTAVAVLSKADRELSINPKSIELSQNIEIAKFYCAHACQVVDCSLQSIFDKNDAQIEQIADSLTRI